MSQLPIRFIGSYPSVAKAPAPSLPEYAFVGRSNVGKSSLINLLAGERGVAKTSGTPGKTQLINFFEVDQAWMLVDLPGYGYAQLSKKHRASLKQMIYTYLAERPTLACAFVLLDAKIPLQPIDAAMIEWLGSAGIPQAWVFTKVDKGRQRDTDKQISLTLKQLGAAWEELPPVFRTSSSKLRGREALLSFIRDAVAAEATPNDES